MTEEEFDEFYYDHLTTDIPNKHWPVRYLFACLILESCIECGLNTHALKELKRRRLSSKPLLKLLYKI